MTMVSVYVSILCIVFTLISIYDARSLNKGLSNVRLGAPGDFHRQGIVKKYYYNIKKVPINRLKNHKTLIAIPKIKDRRRNPKISKLSERLLEGLRSDDKVCGWTLQWKCYNSSDAPTPWWPSYPHYSYYPYYYYPYYYWYG